MGGEGQAGGCKRGDWPPGTGVPPNEHLTAAAYTHHPDRSGPQAASTVWGGTRGELRGSRPLHPLGDGTLGHVFWCRWFCVRD